MDSAQFLEVLQGGPHRTDQLFAPGDDGLVPRPQDQAYRNAEEHQAGQGECRNHGPTEADAGHSFGVDQDYAADDERRDAA